MVCALRAGRPCTSQLGSAPASARATDHTRASRASVRVAASPAVRDSSEMCCALSSCVAAARVAMLARHVPERSLLAHGALSPSVRRAYARVARTSWPSSRIIACCSRRDALSAPGQRAPSSHSGHRQRPACRGNRTHAAAGLTNNHTGKPARTRCLFRTTPAMQARRPRHTWRSPAAAGRLVSR